MKKKPTKPTKPTIRVRDLPYPHMELIIFLRRKMMDHYGHDWYTYWAKFNGSIPLHFKIIR